MERSNLNWRVRSAHLAGKSLTCAKCIRWFKAKFAICVAFYNIIRPHKTLSRGEYREFRPKTPAMVADITFHVWTIKDIIGIK